MKTHRIFFSELMGRLQAQNVVTKMHLQSKSTAINAIWRSGPTQSISRHDIIMVVITHQAYSYKDQKSYLGTLQNFKKTYNQK